MLFSLVAAAMVASSYGESIYNCTICGVGDDACPCTGCGGQGSIVCSRDSSTPRTATIRSISQVNQSKIPGDLLIEGNDVEYLPPGFLDGIAIAGDFKVGKGEKVDVEQWWGSDALESLQGIFKGARIGGDIVVGVSHLAERVIDSSTFGDMASPFHGAIVINVDPKDKRALGNIAPSAFKGANLKAFVVNVRFRSKGCPVDEVGESAFEDAHIGQLDFTICGPSKLGINAFKGFHTNSEYLHMTRGGIRVIPRGAFANSNIKGLYLGGAKYKGHVETLEVGSFDNATLGVLDINDSNLTHIDDAVFETTTIGRGNFDANPFVCPLPLVCERPEVRCGRCTPAPVDDDTAESNI